MDLIKIGQSLLSLAILLSFFGGLFILGTSIRYRHENLPWWWIIKTGFSRHNLTDIGLKKRRLGNRLLLISLALFVVAAVYAKRVMPQKPTATAPAVHRELY